MDLLVLYIQVISFHHCSLFSFGTRVTSIFELKSTSVVDDGLIVLYMQAILLVTRVNELFLGTSGRFEFKFIMHV